MWVSAAADGQSAPGILFLVLGLGATGFGVVAAANVRGAAERLVRLSPAASPLERADRWDRDAPPVNGRSLTFVRCVAGMFAVFGVAMAATGVHQVLSEGLGPSRLPELPFPLMAFTIMAGVAVAGRTWRTGGWLRTAWKAGGTRRGAAGALTLVVVAWGAVFNSGLLLPLLAAWLLGAAAVLVLLVSHDRAPGE